MKKVAVICSIAAIVVSITFSVSLLSAIESNTTSSVSQKAGVATTSSASTPGMNVQSPASAPTMNPQIAQPNMVVPQMPVIPRIVFLKPGEKVVGPDGLPVDEQPGQMPTQQVNVSAAAKGKAPQRKPVPSQSTQKGKVPQEKSAPSQSAQQSQASDTAEKPAAPAMHFEIVAGELVSVDSKDPANTMIKIKTADGKEIEAAVEPYVTVMKTYKIDELPKGEFLTLHCMVDGEKKTYRALSISAGKMEMPDMLPPGIPPSMGAMPTVMPKEGETPKKVKK